MINRNSAKSCENGTSLIEALVSLLIFAISLLGVSSLMLSSISTNRETRRVIAATTLAQDKLEEIRGTNYAAVITGTDGPFSEAGQTIGGGLFFSRAWTVVLDSPVAGNKTVSVNTSWTNQNGNIRNVQLVSIIVE